MPRAIIMKIVLVLSNIIKILKVLVCRACQVLMTSHTHRPVKYQHAKNKGLWFLCFQSSEQKVLFKIGMDIEFLEILNIQLPYSADWLKSGVKNPTNSN